MRPEPWLLPAVLLTLAGCGIVVRDAYVDRDDYRMHDAPGDVLEVVLASTPSSAGRSA